MSPARVPSRNPRLGLVVLTALLLAMPLVPTASAQNPVYGLDDRVFPEPMQATSFLQYPDFVAGLETLNERHGEYMDVRIIGESVERRPIYFVELTNEESEKTRDEKLQIGYSASIHANEAAGREGMVRVLEDLVSGTGALGDMQPYLDDLILNVWFPNPDSWASGDYFTVDPARVFEGAPGYARGNSLGVDLNREFPNPGWIYEPHTPMSEPESQSVVKELRYSGRHSNLVAGTDLHGMINSPNMMRAIIPNQDMDFHRMMVTMRFLSDLEQRVNDSPHFAEWQTLAQALCLLPGVEVPPVDDDHDAHDDDHGHAHASFEDLPASVRAAAQAVDDGDEVWSLEEAQAFAAAAECGQIADGPTGGVGHGQPFLWGARWDQIGYTDSGFTSDYLMLSPRSPTGGMGAVGTITEFAYSHMVPDNKYVPKLNDMHVAGVRETVRAQIEYTLLSEWPTLTETGKTLYVESDTRITSEDDPNPYKSKGGKQFDLADVSTWFDFEQVPYDVANTDFWRELAQYSKEPINATKGDAITPELLATYDHLVITDHTIDSVPADTVRTWVEAGGTLILTDGALRWFDEAGITTGAAYDDTHYLGHSDLIDKEHPLLDGVYWNARATTEGPPIGYAIREEVDGQRKGVEEYPQWHLKADALAGLDLHVAGTTHDDPSLGTAKIGAGQVHFIGAALAQPTQHRDHRYGLAPYAVSALTYQVFLNALGGAVAWEDQGKPFVPHYPADPLYGQTTEAEPEEVVEGTPAPLPLLIVPIALLGAALMRLGRKR